MKYIYKFFSVFDKMPSTHGIKTYGAPKFFAVEELFLYASGISWTMPFMFLLGLFALFTGVIFYDFEPEVLIPIERYMIFFIILVFIPLFMHSVSILLFSRKVDDEQLQAMVKWHETLIDLPKPHKDMTKKDLALYVDAIYQKESENREKFTLID